MPLNAGRQGPHLRKEAAMGPWIFAAFDVVVAIAILVDALNDDDA
jgi:hypothetical protein